MINVDSLKQVILQEVRTENNHLFILIGIILLSALIGGLVSWVFRNDPLPEEKNGVSNNNGNDKPKEIKKYSLLNALLVGLAGAVIVPLFLNLGGNGILKDSQTNPANYFAFAGFCVLGAVFARDFLNSMGKTLLKRVDDLDKKIDEKVSEAIRMKEEAQKESSQKVIDSTQLLRNEFQKRFTEVVQPESKVIFSDSERSELTTRDKTRSISEIIKEIDRKIDENVNRVIGTAPFNDIQKNQWGGKQRSNDREITATVKKLRKFWYKINITVKSTNTERPLESPVLLYVHDTFQYRNNRIILDVEDNNIAREELRAVGSFTVGAVCDNGDTILELDLAELPGVDQEFRDN